MQMVTPANWTPAAHPPNDISTEFEIPPKFAVLWFKMYSADHNKILHLSQQCNKILLWLVDNILN